MRHRRYFVEELKTAGQAIPSRGGTLIVARKEESPDLDWELVHQSSEVVTFEQAPYQLEMSGPELNFRGNAILVRSDGRAHVFRGAGDLEGFTDAEFDQTEPVADAAEYAVLESQDGDAVVMTADQADELLETQTEDDA